MQTFFQPLSVWQLGTPEKRGTIGVELIQRTPKAGKSLADLIHLDEAARERGVDDDDEIQDSEKIEVEDISDKHREIALSGL